MARSRQPTKAPPLLDKMLVERLRESINMSVPWYLMASYAYYELDRPFLTDAVFDGLAKLMLQHWDHIEHRHKGFITEDDLRAGSLLRRDFPEVVRGAALSLLG